METITFATTNPAKLAQIRGALKARGIEVISIEDREIPEIVEDGNTALENAEKKALAYAKSLGEVVLSMDNGLYIEGLPDELQPGLNVRRIPDYKGRPSDTEMVSYYTSLIEKIGDETKGYWEFGVCMATPNGAIFGDVIKSERVFVSNPSRIVVEGYPLESLQIDPKSRKYISEMTEAEKANFWSNVIGKLLLEFVLKAESELGL